jgi:hypothetical protein
VTSLQGGYQGQPVSNDGRHLGGRASRAHRNEFETSLNGYLLRTLLSASRPCSGVRTILSQRTTELGVCAREGSEELAVSSGLIEGGGNPPLESAGEEVAPSPASGTRPSAGETAASCSSGRGVRGLVPSRSAISDRFRSRIRERRRGRTGVDVEAGKGILLLAGVALVLVLAEHAGGEAR